MEVGEVNLVQMETKNAFSIQVENWQSVYQLAEVLKLTMEFDGTSHFRGDRLICLFDDYEQALFFKLTLELDNNESFSKTI